MKTFTRGQRARLDSITSSLDLEIGLGISASGKTLDFCCFGLDTNSQLSDDRYFVFYNQSQAPGGTIKQVPASRPNESSFKIQLGNLPGSIKRLVFTASFDGAGQMSQISSGFLSLSDASGELVRYDFAGRDFDKEGALMIGEIYWKDGWRIGAIGQGFAGNLSALLKHFGGEEVEGDSTNTTTSTPAPTSTTPSANNVSPPPTPTSAPPMPVSSAVLTPQIVPAPEGSLQSVIDGAPVGSTVQLPRGEYQGPIVIRKPLILNAPGAVIWAQNGPVVTVASAGVVLQEFEIEATAPESNIPNSDVALLAQVAPSLHRVGVRGRVVGMGEPSDDWKLPIGLDLGEFAPRLQNTFSFSVTVPLVCELKATITGVEIQPARIEAGTHEINLSVRDVLSDTFLAGKIEVRAGELVRSIFLSGRSTPTTLQPVQNKKLN